MQSLFLALVLYPEVWKKAQAEVENRLPDFDDCPSLPYVNALVKELMRWHLVGPVGELSYHHGYLPLNWFEGLPHMATNPDFTTCVFPLWHQHLASDLYSSSSILPMRLVNLFLYFGTDHCLHPSFHFSLGTTLINRGEG